MQCATPASKRLATQIDAATPKPGAATQAASEKQSTKMEPKLNDIIIRGLRLYAYHGVMPQERAVGAYFTIDATIAADFTRAMYTDELEGTISYADIFDTIKQEMAIPSRLVEHAAARIADAILANFPTAHSARITLIKENPPMGADCKGAGVEVCKERE